jgi:hypothetical protein
MEQYAEVLKTPVLQRSAHFHYLPAVLAAKKAWRTPAIILLLRNTASIAAGDEKLEEEKGPNST